MEPTAYYVVGLVAIGMGASFFIADPRSPTSRPLSLFFVVAGCAFLLNPAGAVLTARAPLVRFFAVCETVIICSGFEWGLRVKCQADPEDRRAVAWTRAGQGMAVIYGLLGILFPDLEALHWKVVWNSRSLGDPAFLLFAVPFFAAATLPVVPFFRGRQAALDPAEVLRLTALLSAGPFWIVGMIAPVRWKPIWFALGEIVFLGGAIRYHVVQGQRGQFLARFVSPAVAIVARERGLASAMQRTRVELSVVACDLRGFTAFAETGAPEEVMKLLEEYYAAVADAVAALGGSIKDFAGDGILALVGAPVALPDHARRAVEIALAIHERGESVVGRWRRLGLDVGLGVGVASGFATVGAIGGTGRLEYGAVGPAVNLASRLAARAAAGEVLAEPRVVGLAGDGDYHFEKLEAAELKGFARAVTLYAVTRGRKPVATEARA